MKEQLTISIRFFAKAKEVVGQDSISIDIPLGSSIDDLKIILAQKYSQLQNMLPHLLFSLDDEYVTGETKLKMGDEIACFPPVSGG